MTTWLASYLGTWLAACLVAAILVLRDPGAFAITRREYWRFLLRPWKVITFAIAITALAVAAPLSRDPTWDVADSVLISTLVFCLAPWAVGEGYRALFVGPSVRRTLVAATAFLFAASWSYDLYIVLRDGHYPTTWLSNLRISGFITLVAGLFWNLDHVRGEGCALAFRRPDWPAPERTAPFLRIAGFALPLMVLVILITVTLLWMLRRGV